MFLVTYTDILTVKSHNLISKYTVLKFAQNILKKYSITFITRIWYMMVNLFFTEWIKEPDWNVKKMFYTILSKCLTEETELNLILFVFIYFFSFILIHKDCAHFKWRTIFLHSLCWWMLLSFILYANSTA